MRMNPLTSHTTSNFDFESREGGAGPSIWIVGGQLEGDNSDVVAFRISVRLTEQELPVHHDERDEYGTSR